MTDAATASSWVDTAAALTAEIERADVDGCDARFARGDHWLTIERAAGSEEPAAEIAVELNISHKTYLQERHVSRVWTAAERIYRLTWSHYRAAAYCDDRTIAADVMADAEQNVWGEGRVGREIAARVKGQPGEDDAPMPNPDDFDDAAGYCTAMLVQSGMREAKAARLVGDVLRWRAEWVGDGATAEHGERAA